MSRRLAAIIALLLFCVSGVSAQAPLPTPLIAKRIVSWDMPTKQPTIVGALVRTVEYTAPNGQTAKIQMFASTPEARKRMEDLADRLQRVNNQRPMMNDDGTCDLEDGSNCLLDGSEDGSGQGNNKIIVWLCIATFWDGVAGAACAVYFAGQIGR